ncbi:hypothetical protein [Adhaeribacter arboris]|uniref:hypothetical protein n=1 Tax=Adhaeribacter arboris TaxID=2072846 RepID=UPI00130491E7|nr:hypothetical protein [Adhaeribacter arboris]
MMNVNLLTRRVALSILFCFALAFSANAQKQTLIGLNVNGELYPGSFRPTFG